MAKYSFKESMKIAAKEKEYVKTLDENQKADFKSMSRQEKDDTIWNYINGGEEMVSHGQEKTETWLKKKGIYNPTEVTLDAIYPLITDSKLSTFNSNWAGITTLSIDKQAIMSSHLIQQKQNYTLIAQNDEIIKQNNEIIHLLREIAKK